MRLDNTELIAEKIEIIDGYVSEILAKYNHYSNMFKENIQTIKKDFDNKLIDFLSNNFMPMTTSVKEYRYDGKNLTIDYTYEGEDIGLVFKNVDIKLYINGIDDNEKIENIISKLNNKSLDLYKKYCFDIHQVLSIKKVDTNYEYGI